MKPFFSFPDHPAQRDFRKSPRSAITLRGFALALIIAPTGALAQSANLNGCNNYVPASFATVICSSAYPTSTQGVQSATNTSDGNNVTVTIDSSAQRSIFGSTIGIGSAGTVTNNGSLTTQGATYSYGISFGANGRSQAGGNTAINNGSIATNSSNSTAIYVKAQGSTAAANSVTNTGRLSTSGAAAYGIFADTTAAASTIINSGTITTTGSGSHAIYADSTTGNNNITNNGAINSGARGILSNSTTGINTILNSGSIAATRSAIFANGTTGAINISNLTGGSLVSTGSSGIEATTTSGLITIANGNGSSISAAEYGIYAETQSGNIAINNGSTIGSMTNPVGNVGLYARSFSGGNISIINTGAIESNYMGLRASNYQNAGNGTITINNSGKIISHGQEDAIWVQSFNGNINIQNSGDLISDNYHGLHGQADGTGSVTITNTGNIKSASDSIIGESNGGSVSVTSSGNLSSSTGNGIRVKSTNNASISNSGTVSAFSSAINVFNVGNGQTTIANTGSLIGSGATAPTAVIAIDPAGAGNVTPTFITNDGVISPTSGAPGGLAIAAGARTDGAITINNPGALTGRLQLTDNNVAGVFDSITNSGVWNTSGDNKFYIGADLISNIAGGRINAFGATNFDMGGEAPVFENTFINAGTLKISNGADGSAGVLRIFSTGNENLVFNNTGTIDLSNTTPNEKPNTLIIQGDLYSPPSPGQPKPEIIVDTPTGGEASQIIIDGDATNFQADLTVVPDTAGSNNPIGSAVVSIEGSTEGSNITLDPNSPGFNINNGTPIVNAGLYYYYLGNSTGTPSCANGYTCWSLYSAPSAAAKTLPIAVTSAQTLWQETALMWEDRLVELRDSARYRANNAANQSASSCEKGRDCSISTWIKSVGSWTDRSNYQTHFGGNGVAFSYNLGYRQNSLGMLGGAEWSKTGILKSNDFFAVGVMGGYLQSNVNFNQENGNLYGSSNFYYQGGTVGGSLTYMTNGFFADALIKADLLGVNMTLPIATMRSASLGASTIGGIGNLGYRFDYERFFLEPLATLTYSSTGMGSINNLAYQNIGITFGNGDDFRGGFGGRAGFSFANILSSHVLEASLTGRYWNMFNSNAGRTVTILSSGIGDTLGDYTLGRDYGEVKGNLNLFSTCSGWSAFVNTGVKWNDQFTTVTTRGGVAYRW